MMGSPNKIDLSGRQFGGVVVLGVAGTRGASWRCRCACGTDFIVPASRLLKGNVASCGCRQQASFDDITNRLVAAGSVLVPVATSKSNDGSWKFRCVCGSFVEGYFSAVTKNKSCGCLTNANISKALKRDDTDIKEVFASYKKGAEIRGLSFSVPFSAFSTLVTMPCTYCGAPPSNRKRDLPYNGLDRVDNSRGYESDNVAPCCFTCNFAKRTMSLDTFRAWLLRAFLHQNLELLDEAEGANDPEQRDRAS